MLLTNQLNGFGYNRVNRMLDAVTEAGLNANLKLCLDAGDIASYPGSGQVWYDVSGNGYDFYRGTNNTSEGSDPTFNGTAGKQGAYFSFDGGDYFDYDTASPETWMSNLHKDNAKYSLVIYAYNTGTAAYRGLARTRGAGVAVGWETRFNNANKLETFTVNGGGTASSWASSASVPSSQWSFLAVSVDEAVGANGAILQINSTQELFTSTYSSPSASAATNPIRIGEGDTFFLDNGSRIGAVLMWEGRTLSASELNYLFALSRGFYGI